MDPHVSLKISSYNCQGFKPRNYDFLKKLFSNINIRLLQEHWLYDFESSLITTVLPGSACHALSSMDSAELRRGRGYGGTAIVWHQGRAEGGVWGGVTPPQYFTLRGP